MRNLFKKNAAILAARRDLSDTELARLLGMPALALRLEDRERARALHAGLSVDSLGVDDPHTRPKGSRPGPKPGGPPAARPDSSSYEAAAEAAIHFVAELSGVPVKRIKMRDRSSRPAKARHCVCYALRHETNLSLGEIGEAVGGRNHTSVMRAVRGIDESIDNSDTWAIVALQARRFLRNWVERYAPGLAV